MSQHRKWMLSMGLATAMLVGGAVQAQDQKRLETLVDKAVARDHFSGAVLVAKGDQVLLDKGYGSANLEWNIPNSPSTKFRLGSVTKQFTAASVLLLQERGKLAVSDPVSKYLGGLPAAWSKVTIFQLLNHTSGIANFTSTKEYQAIEPFTKKPEESVALVRDKPLEFESGSRFSYSNTGYVLLGALIEKVSGQTYDAFVRQNIFEPLGMKDSGYDWNANVLPNRAAGYARGKNGMTNAGFINMSIPHAAGALYSTTGDLLRWQRGLYEGKLLSPASLEAMTTPYHSGYGFGLGIQQKDGGKEVGHGGGIEGFATEVHYRMADKISVIVLSNVEGSELESLTAGLTATARGVTYVMPTERKDIALSAEQMAAIAGTYTMPDGRRLWLRTSNGGMTTQLQGQASLPIYAESADKLFLRKVDAQLELHRDAAGKVEAVTLLQGGRNMRMPRVDEAPPADDSPAAGQ
ncbi:hypothetical protein RugamoR64_27390 [Duganella rhizosphaerae]|uniref:serine hydrolase n=1 Tax=Duganella rhizosphaerae TaxID=2885763 RepID=UPI0030EA5D00